MNTSNRTAFKTIDVSQCKFIAIHFISDVPNGMTVTNLMISTQEAPYEPYWKGAQNAPITKIISEGVNLCNVEPKTYGSGDNARSCVGWIKVKRNTHYYITVSSYENKKPKFAVFGIPADKYVEVKKAEDIFSSQTTIGAVTVATDANDFDSNTFDYIGFRCYNTNAFYGLPADVKFCVSEVDEYQPYELLDTITIPSEDLSGYGLGLSTITNEIDFENNTYTQNVVSGSVGPNEWMSSNNYFQCTLESLGLPSAVSNSQAILENYTYGSSTAPAPCWWLNSEGTGIRIKDSRFDTTDALKAYLEAHPLTIVYQVAKPEIKSIAELDNLIKVVPNGHITFVNENHCDVHSTITYQLLQKEGAEA